MQGVMVSIDQASPFGLSLFQAQNKRDLPRKSITSWVNDLHPDAQKQVTVVSTYKLSPYQAIEGYLLLLFSQARSRAQCGLNESCRF